jgi:hypothetical protein
MGAKVQVVQVVTDNFTDVKDYLIINGGGV